MPAAATSSSPGTKPLAVWPVVLGAVLGVLTGLFLGDGASVLSPIGQLYAMLLEVAVYPYLICSLLHGLGSMSPGNAWKLFRAGWKFYALLWLITFAALGILALGIPSPLPITLESAPAGAEKQLLNLLIPSDLFHSLSQNYVPGVVLFCIFYGIALQHVPEKQPLLSVLEGIRLASLKFWNAVVHFAPLAVFSLFAANAGTLRIEALQKVSLFLFLFLSGSLLLTFWLIPACITAFTPLRYRDVLSDLKSAFLVVIATTLSVSALPYITSATRRLIEKLGVDGPEAPEIIRTNISVAYPLGQLGNFFVYLFIVFAAYFNHTSLPTLDSLILPLVTLLSCVGSPTSSVDAVDFLSKWLNLSPNTTEFYISLMTITRYGQVVVSVAGFAFLSFGVTLAYYGKLKFRKIALLRIFVLGSVVLAGCAGLGRWIDERFMIHHPDPYLSFTLDPALQESVHATIETDFESKSPVSASLPPLERIQQSGELRVGYNASIIPFCYYNSGGDLVGYDVAFAYQLARDLNVRLRFIPFRWPKLADDLQAHRFDIAMSGIYVTSDRLLRVDVSKPYYQSPLAFFTLRERAKWFKSRTEISERSPVKLGVFNDPVLIPRLKRTFPSAEIVVVQNYETVPDFSKMDGAIWTLVQAESLAAAHPDLIAVEPSDLGNPYLFAYLLPKGSDELTQFVNYWLQLQQTGGFEAAQHDYWLNRLPRADNRPRWSVLHNVLKW